MSEINSSMEYVEELLNQTFTDHELETNVNDMCNRVIRSGGKRIRPRLLLLCAAALKKSGLTGSDKDICSMAAAIELLHTATLIHDDVIDVSPLRRGQPTLNSTDGNHAAVLAGDYMFTRCFDLVQRTENFELLRRVSFALRMLVTGELFQMKHEGDTSLSTEMYTETVYCKTGVLFELACDSAGILTSASAEQREKLRSFGKNLGIAFQIRDDILDYCSDSASLGKDVGIDLKDQRITLPVILALKSLDQNAADQLLDDIKNSRFAEVKKAITESGAVELCEKEALRVTNLAADALSFLPDCEYKEELLSFCQKVVSRNN